MADITKINLNGTDLTIVDSAATSAIAGEIARAQGAESAITSALSAEVVARESADTQLQTALSGKADTATTLAGYGITDAYTSAQTNSAITQATSGLASESYVQSAITAATSGLQETLTPGTGIEITSGNVINCTIDTGLYVVVTTLPAQPAAGNENKIHLVPDPSGTTGNEYIEYLWKGDAWEEIGKTTAEIDLSDYWTSAQTESAISQAISEIVIPDPTILEPVSTLPGSADTGAVVALNSVVGGLPAGFSYVESTTLGEQNDRTGITLTVAFSAASGYSSASPLSIFTVNGVHIYACQNEFHTEGVNIMQEDNILLPMYKDSEDAGTYQTPYFEANYHYTDSSDEYMVVDFYNLSGETAPVFVFPSSTTRGVYQKSENSWVDITAGVDTKIDNHIANHSNPHSVTAAQLGISASYSAATETLILNIPTAS